MIADTLIATLTNADWLVIPVGRKYYEAAMADMSDRLTIRGVDIALWRRARLAALHLDLTMGEAVNEALRGWLASVLVSQVEGDGGERSVVSLPERTDTRGRPT